MSIGTWEWKEAYKGDKLELLKREVEALAGALNTLNNRTYLMMHLLEMEETLPHSAHVPHTVKKKAPANG